MRHLQREAKTIHRAARVILRKYYNLRLFQKFLPRFKMTRLLLPNPTRTVQLELKDNTMRQRSAPARKQSAVSHMETVQTLQQPMDRNIMDTVLQNPTLNQGQRSVGVKFPSQTP